MKRIYAVFLVAILMSFSKINVLALDSTCTQEEQIRLRKLATITQITYDFEKSYDPEQGTNIYGYRVDINGFQPEFQVSDEENYIYFQYNGTSVSTARGFIGGVTYKLSFYANASSPCNGQLILIKNLSLLPYNQYSEDPLCKGHEEYALCKKFTSLNIGSYSDFVKLMNKYIESLNNKEPEKPTNEITQPKRTILGVIEDFIIEYYFIILMFIIIAGTTGIIIIEVRKRRSIL